MTTTKASGRTTAKKAKPRSLAVGSDTDEEFERVPRKDPLDHLRSRKKKVWRRVAIAMDHQLLVERDRLKGEAAQLELQMRISGNKEAKQEELEQVQDELEDAEAALAENVAWFHVESIGPKPFDKLVSEHPPTDEQRRQAKKDGIGALLYNQDTFLPVLIARCVSYVLEDGDQVTLVPLTEEFLKEMQEGDQWTQGEILELAQVATEVNQNTRRVGDLGNASRRTR